MQVESVTHILSVFFCVEIQYLKATRTGSSSAAERSHESPACAQVEIGHNVARPSMS